MEVNLQSALQDSAFAFRGYNIANLGRSTELLKHSAYGPLVRKHLRIGSQICSDVTGRKVDLVRRVRERHETSLRTYADAISLVICLELAQLELVKE